jgi:hypothetical protein
MGSRYTYDYNCLNNIAIDWIFFIWVTPCKRTSKPSDSLVMGYNDGFSNAECHSKYCHDHLHDKRSGQSKAYDEGYAKGYHDGWNKASGGGIENTERSTQNGTSSLSVPRKGEEVQNNINNNGGCDPKNQFCAMTNLLS